MKTLVLLPAAIVVALLTGATARGYDQKVISPGACQPYGQSSTYDTLAIRADGVQNKTTNTNKYVICPIDRDQESAWSSGTDGVTLRVYVNRLGSGSISCTFTEGQDFSGLAPTASYTVNAALASGTIWIVQFNDIGISSGLAGTITCRLPPQAKYLTTIIEESGATDGP